MYCNRNAQPFACCNRLTDYCLMSKEQYLNSIKTLANG